MIDAIDLPISVGKKNFQYFAVKNDLKCMRKQYRRHIFRLPDRKLRVMKAPKFLENDAPLPNDLKFRFDIYI
jgi:hypothetical protein